MYRTMLRAMTDEQRFTVAARLTHGVLGGVVDGALTVSDEASVPQCLHALTPTRTDVPPAQLATSPRTAASDNGSVTASIDDLVAEVFTVLSCPEIRVASAARRRSADAAAEAAAADPVDAMAAAKGRMLSKLARKNTMENVVPVLIALKNMLQAARSPLLGALMQYLKHVFSEYRDDLKGTTVVPRLSVAVGMTVTLWLFCLACLVPEMLAADRQLEQEVEYDLRMYEEQQKQRTAASARRRSSFGSTRSARRVSIGSPIARTPGTAKVNRHSLSLYNMLAGGSHNIHSVQMQRSRSQPTATPLPRATPGTPSALRSPQATLARCSTPRLRARRRLPKYECGRLLVHVNVMTAMLTCDRVSML